MGLVGDGQGVAAEELEENEFEEVVDVDEHDEANEVEQVNHYISKIIYQVMIAVHYLTVSSEVCSCKSFPVCRNRVLPTMIARVILIFNNYEVLVKVNLYLSLSH